MQVPGPWHGEHGCAVHVHDLLALLPGDARHKEVEKYCDVPEAVLLLITPSSRTCVCMGHSSRESMNLGLPAIRCAG